MPIYLHRFATSVFAGFLFTLIASADENAKQKVEFRRAAAEPAEGLSKATVVGSDQKVYLFKDAELTTEDISSARLVTESDGAFQKIEIRFSEVGAKKAWKLSTEHLGKPLAILVDGKVISAPIIRAKFNGAVDISGTFDQTLARNLVKAVGGK